MEVYSTVLWHLKQEVELAHLAQEAVEWDRRSPHAWTIMGNCFSLQKVPTASPDLPQYLLHDLSRLLSCCRTEFMVLTPLQMQMCCRMIDCCTA
jgi:hypothetical protein